MMQHACAFGWSGEDCLLVVALSGCGSCGRATRRLADVVEPLGVLLVVRLRAARVAIPAVCARGNLWRQFGARHFDAVLVDERGESDGAAVVAEGRVAVERGAVNTRWGELEIARRQLNQARVEQPRDVQPLACHHAEHRLPLEGVAERTMG
eukprot:CAMPEP_0119360372 /NCGR_PEP_ID=MMETSP1334-20130426/8000_1 /TAXON_ID=127549 /ORGANISM="Calcidiscus leptoporus, Strain RCC1130" /LENGTH=151 /DNA_ID=CAMNT_0007375207 /DNA_START=332 /DNA_END=787 /DNA_ORIENTATION=+